MIRMWRDLWSDVQVTAGAGLAHALSSSLMQLELHRKEPQPRRGTQSADPPPIGLAQVSALPPSWATVGTTANA